MTNKKIQNTISDKLKNIPNKPGIYQFKDSDGKILYIGKAKNLRNRVRQYFQKSKNLGPKTLSMLEKVSDFETIVTDSEVEALILEANLIKEYKPKYNIFLRDDKSYPYIVITNEPYPRIFVTRRIVRDGAKYFGPFTDVKHLRASLKMIRDIFKVRSCNYHIDEETIKKKKIRVCLDYHIKKCEGPCEGLVTREHYNKMIGEVAQILRGKSTSLLNDLEKQMNDLSERMEFEEAAKIRDKIRAIQNYTEKQKVVDSELIDRDIFAVAVENRIACGVVFKIRDGKLIGRQSYYLSGSINFEEKEIISQLVRNYYLEADYFPKEIFLPCEIDDKETIEKWVSEKRNERVCIYIPKIGDKAKLVAMCQMNARYLLDEIKIQKLKSKQKIAFPIKALQEDLKLESLPQRIECFDISNLQGTDTVASLVVFENGKPKKSEYRMFKIKTVPGPDDYASIREVVYRRYSRLLEEDKQLPDLIIVDGGKGQLSSAVSILKNLQEVANAKDINKIPIIGLAKRLEEIYTPNSNEPIVLPRTSSSLKLLQRIRDEAHRFAIEYHRKLRNKRTLRTELDLIQGIGKKRAKELLEVFGSVQGVKFATYEQLVEIVGEKIANRIKEHFAIELEANNNVD
ncbi:MAG: Excinuclease ABC subunit C [Ignavibacteriae bacterium]|nr:MAG: Excinuclease ABC subunit C [Ignavibacteriota bacterium]